VQNPAFEAASLLVDGQQCQALPQQQGSSPATAGSDMHSKLKRMMYTFYTPQVFL
jgi:hypothetical protein